MALAETDRKHAWDMAVYAEATRKVFDQRYRRLRRWTRARDFLALAVPISLAYFAGSDLIAVLKPFKPYATAALAALASLQALLALWALIAQWDESLFRYKRSFSDNHAIRGEWGRLASSTTASNSELDYFNSQQKVLDARDVEENVTEKEQQRGMRAGLILFKRKCVCDRIPSSTRLPWAPKIACPVCGGN